MEEVDEIVLHTLRQIGCDVEEVNSLREFTTETVIQGVIRCLKLIDPTLDLPNNVPPSMSARYRLGSTLASICSNLGYKGEIGYQTFLYSNETDLRRIFLFLVENLPKESEKALDEPLNKQSAILKETANQLTQCLNRPWLPYYCSNDKSFSAQFHSTVLFSRSKYNHIPEKVASSFHEKHVDLISKQVDSQIPLLCSLLQDNTLSYIKENIWNQDDLSSVMSRKELVAQKQAKIKKTINDYLAQALQQKSLLLGEDAKVHTSPGDKPGRGSRFTHSLDLQFTPEKDPNSPLTNIDEKGDSKEDKQKKREEEIKELQERVDTLSAKMEQLSNQNSKYKKSLSALSDQMNKGQEQSDKLKEKYRVKKCTLSLLPDAETNIQKLQSLIDASSQRLLSLANQWEQHRVPLVDQYRELKELSSKRVNETQRKLEEIKELREKIRNIGNEARQKDEMHKHLSTAYEKLTKDVSRSSYTRRIMEIVGNIKKQKAEIDKVLLDTRNVQKEINRLSGKLERTFTVTDELIFRDAKKDEAIRRAYKYLAALHENCSQLVQIVEETGSIIREIRELEDQIEQENQKKIAATLERIMSDYKQMQRENASLIAQLK